MLEQSVSLLCMFCVSEEICARFPKMFVIGSNVLGEEGEAALRKAIEGRSGFELLL